MSHHAFEFECREAERAAVVEKLAATPFVTAVDHAPGRVRYTIDARLTRHGDARAASRMLDVDLRAFVDAAIARSEDT